MDKELVNAIKDILENVEMYGNNKKNMKLCYISAYQLAMLLDKNYRSLLDSLGYHQNIGGKGLGKHNSLAMRISKELSDEIKKNTQFDIEIAFFCTNDLEQFSFRDEKDILREPSGKCFSMFKINETDSH